MEIACNLGLRAGNTLTRENDRMQLGAYVTELVLRCHRYEKRVAATLGLSVDETHALSQLFLHNPSCVKDLTGRLGVSSTRMSRVLLMMERKGLIRRRSSPVDHRVEQVSLTVGGTALVGRLMEISEQSGGDLFNGLPACELPRSRCGTEEEEFAD